ncbi:MAG: hypothetical protein Q4A72_05665 [Bacillota bacterium]|nr:hypothetical protein [Bacillota bacterium]
MNTLRALLLVFLLLSLTACMEDRDQLFDTGRAHLYGLNKSKVDLAQAEKNFKKAAKH